MKVCFSVLTFGFAEVDCLAIDAHRRSRFHARSAEPQCFKLFCESVAGRFAHSSTLNHGASDVHQAIEEGASGEHDCLGIELHAHLRHSTCDFEFGLLPYPLEYKLADSVLPD